MKKPTVLLLGVLLLQYSCSLHFAISSANSNFTDQSALLDIQSKLTFDPTKTVLGGNWTTTTSFCNWIGVSCSKRRQRATALNLSYMGLQGTISPHVGNLSFLVSLDLRNNSFFGFLPHEISHLHRLRILVLQDNQLEGNIPPTLYHCQQLEIISLAANRLNGLIPKELGFLPRLQQLYLGKNSLMSGEIPSSLGNISTLNRLSLDQCGLTGSFPYALLNLSSLVAISLYDNNISGILPTDICDNHWPNVQILSVSYNNFSGQIPSRIHRCAQLVSLSLSYNSLVGSIPREIGSFQYLEELYLGGNNLTGTIPPTIGDDKYSHLKKLEKSSKNLKLFKADLLDYDSLRAAIEGCHEVFHVASPVPSTTVLNSEVEVIELAVKGTLNVFKASLEVKIERVVPLLLLCPSILGGLKVKCWMRLVGGMRA